eukprot:m.52138 g.52138  ORF g.52138 m.52138 type:complete len:267 (+) comp7353_c0_seq1:217-1017(+)
MPARKRGGKAPASGKAKQDDQQDDQDHTVHTTDDGATTTTTTTTTPATTASANSDGDHNDSSDDEDTPRFSFFGSTDNVDLTDSEDSQASDKDSVEDNDADGSHGAKRQRVALPPVSALFSEDTTPSFLEAPSFAPQVEVQAFDRRAQPEVNPQRWLKKSQTVEVTDATAVATQPLPATGIAAEVQRAAMMNSVAYKDTAPKEKAAKTPIHELNKKKKGDTNSAKSFATKEKRKRDLGMQAREKSTVEEEKRVLRQEYAGAGLGFD